MPAKIELLGRDLAELTTLARDAGHPAYRGRQIYEGLYRDWLASPHEISTLPIGLREYLQGLDECGLPAVERRFASTDGTVRYLLSAHDGRTVEAVYIPDERRDTLCVSTQVGCPVDCKFCFTALMGLERNLTAGEIVAQVVVLGRAHGLRERRRPLNVVMMGMGEPLLNFDAVMRATQLLADPRGVGIPQRRITVSTAGVVPKIREHGMQSVRGKLAVSLNASNADQRAQLMPITARYGFDELLDACRRYPLRPWERLTFEYVLLRDVNDTDRDAVALRRLLSPLKCGVNLIAHNPGPGIPYQTPEPERVESFREIVHRGIPCFIRKPRGRDIFAACGQLKRTTEVAPAAADDTGTAALPLESHGL